MSNLGRWDRWYSLLDDTRPYGDTVTYQLGADWLAGCAVVEDWGCGAGWFKQFVPGADYRGIDGSHSPYADVIADLRDYRSNVDGIFMRHVLEHDYFWADILTNAVASCRRLALVTFTPLLDHGVKVLTVNDDPHVPDIAFSAEVIEQHLTGTTFQRQTIKTATQYGVETIWTVERSSNEVL